MELEALVVQVIAAQRLEAAWVLQAVLPAASTAICHRLKLVHVHGRAHPECLLEAVPEASSHR